MDSICAHNSICANNSIGGAMDSIGVMDSIGAHNSIGAMDSIDANGYDCVHVIVLQPLLFILYKAIIYNIYIIQTKYNIK